MQLPETECICRKQSASVRNRVQLLETECICRKRKGAAKSSDQMTERRSFVSASGFAGNAPGRYVCVSSRGRRILILDNVERERERTDMENEKVYQMKFAKIYPLLVNKAVKKNRTKEEVDTVICWLTGYRAEDLKRAEEEQVCYGDFFRCAPHLNENRKLITGKVCGVKVEDIEEPLMQEIRYLDKLIDELAKGREMEKILRK